MTGVLEPIASRIARRPRISLGAAVMALAAVAAYAVEKDRHTLRRIAEACVADARRTGSPFPCLKVDLKEGEDRGYVIFRPPWLNDTVLVPTRRISGVEDPFLASPDAPNYFADAWRERSVLTRPDGAAPARDRLSLFVNSKLVRTQDQLHIHIACLKPAARRTLTSVAPRLPVGEWRLIAAVVPHQPFWVLRLGRADLDGVDPFRLADQLFGGVAGDPAQLTVAVAGATVGGEDDLLILATYAHAPGSWWPVGAENLLDSRCAPEPLSEPDAAVGGSRGPEARGA